MNNNVMIRFGDGAWLVKNLHYDIEPQGNNVYIKLKVKPKGRVGAPIIVNTNERHEFTLHWTAKTEGILVNLKHGGVGLIENHNGIKTQGFEL